VASEAMGGGDVVRQLGRRKPSERWWVVTPR
jgi:hypothetical protein